MPKLLRDHWQEAALLGAVFLLVFVLLYRDQENRQQIRDWQEATLLSQERSERYRAVLGKYTRDSRATESVITQIVAEKARSDDRALLLENQLEVWLRAERRCRLGREALLEKAITRRSSDILCRKAEQIYKDSNAKGPAS